MKFNIGDRVQTKLTRTPGTVRWISYDKVAVETDDPNAGVPLPSFEIQRGLFLSADAWEKISPSKIVITSNGKTTLARLYDGNRVIRRAEANCDPSDTYDFATGANLAYDRLMQPDKPAKLKYKVGDRITAKGNVCGICGPGTVVEVDAKSSLCNYLVSFDVQPGPKIWAYTDSVEPLAEPAKEPKPEPKPVKHLYSGKVVCVETHDDFTVGKVYTFKGGKVADDSWTRRPMSSFVAESLEDWNSRYGDCTARFVEYKGEA